MAVKCTKCQTGNPDTQKFCGECGIQLPSPEDIAVTSPALLSLFRVPFIPRLESLGFSGSYIIKGSNILKEVLSASKNQKSFISKERRLFDVY